MELGRGWGRQGRNHVVIAFVLPGSGWPRLPAGRMAGRGWPAARGLAGELAGRTRQVLTGWAACVRSGWQVSALELQGACVRAALAGAGDHLGAARRACVRQGATDEVGPCWPLS